MPLCILPNSYNSPIVNPNVNTGLWMMMVYTRSIIKYSKYTTMMGIVDNKAVHTQRHRGLDR